jgi:hypothetical protein
MNCDLSIDETMPGYSRCVRAGCGSLYPTPKPGQRVYTVCLEGRERTASDKPKRKRTPESPKALARREANLQTLPGSQLHKILSRWLGQKIVAGCGCSSMIGEMNRWGVDGCRTRVDAITDRLVKVATKQQWNLTAEDGVDPTDVGKPVPQSHRTRFLRLLARIVSVTDAGAGFVKSRCRAMVLMAIRRAERAKRVSGELIPTEGDSNGH